MGERLMGWLRLLNPKRLALALIKPRLIELVAKYGDELQEKVKKEVAEKGPGAIDAVFDGAQKAIIAKIEAL